MLYTKLFLTVLVAMAGCSSDPGLKIRIQNSIDSLEQLSQTDRPGFVEDYNESILNDLRTMDLSDFDKPYISYAAVIEIGKKKILRIFWIEGHPSHISIQISNHNEDRLALYEIHEIDALSNQEEASKGVIYHASVSGDKLQVISDVLVPKSNLYVSFVNNGSRVSNKVDLVYLPPNSLDEAR